MLKSSALLDHHSYSLRVGVDVPGRIYTSKPAEVGLWGRWYQTYTGNANKSGKKVISSQ